MNTRQILIDSRDRQFESETGNCKFHLPIGLNGVRSIDLLSANIPLTMYNVNANNNIIYFDDGTPLTATIPVGNYDVFDLVSTIEAQLNASPSALIFVVTYSLITMKLTITGSAPFSFTFSNLLNSMAPVLGFNNVDYPINAIQIATNVVNLSVPIYLKIVINELGSMTKSTNSFDNATFVIFTNKNNSEVQAYNNMRNYRQRIRIINDNIQNLTIKITDYNNKLIDLNGSHWSMLLGLNYSECD